MRRWRAWPSEPAAAPSSSATYRCRRLDRQRQPDPEPMPVGERQRLVPAATAVLGTFDGEDALSQHQQPRALVAVPTNRDSYAFGMNRANYCVPWSAICAGSPLANGERSRVRACGGQQQLPRCGSRRPASAALPERVIADGPGESADALKLIGSAHGRTFGSLERRHCCPAGRAAVDAGGYGQGLGVTGVVTGSSYRTRNVTVQTTCPVAVARTGTNGVSMEVSPADTVFGVQLPWVICMEPF